MTILSDIRKVRFSCPTLVLMAVIIGLIFSANFLTDGLSAFIGETVYAVAAAFGVLLYFTFFVFFAIEKRISKLKLALIATVFVFLILRAWFVPKIDERLHLIEYNLLGWFVMHDASYEDLPRSKKMLFAIATVFLFGASDEGIQALLPYRVGEISDVINNWIGGLSGVMMFMACPVTKEDLFFWKIRR
ncbi:MAG TPA: VanZ family protein [bacterium]|nr:VanZ family protein [bacterium]